MAKVSGGGAEVNARIVYWGIEGAGKRTSLEGVYRKLRPDHRGEMRDVPTRFDPSVSYTCCRSSSATSAACARGSSWSRCRARPSTRRRASSCSIRSTASCSWSTAGASASRRTSRASRSSPRRSRTTRARSTRSRSSCSTTSAISPTPTAREELHRRLGLAGATVFEAVATEGTGLLQALSTISKKVIRALREESIGAAQRRTAARAEPAAARVPRSRSSEPRRRASPQREARAARTASAAVPTPQEVMEEAILARARITPTSARSRPSRRRPRRRCSEPAVAARARRARGAERACGSAPSLVDRVGRRSDARRRAQRAHPARARRRRGRHARRWCSRVRIDPLLAESGD